MLPLETIEEFRKKKRSENPELKSPADLEREIKRVELWDILLDVANGITDIVQAEKYIVIRMIDAIYYTPSVEEKYGDADRLNLIRELLKEGE